MRISDWSSDVCSSDLPVAAQHVGPVGVEGDAAEALGLALGAQHAVRGIEAHELRVGRRVDDGIDLDRRRVSVAKVDDQVAALQPPVVPDTAADAHRGRGQPVATQQQRRSEEHTSALQSLMRLTYADICYTKHIIHANT